MKRIALIVDHPQRDLPGLVLLATRLCELGAGCIFVPMNLKTAELPELDCDFVLLNSFRKGHEAFVSRLLKLGIMVGLQDSEGGPIADLGEYELMMSADRRLRRQLAAYFPWGPRYAAEAVQRNWYRADQVQRTGSPRFDFYAPAMRGLALRASDHAPIPCSPMVLICNKSPFANPAFSTPDRDMRLIHEQYGFDRGYARLWQESQRQAMDGLIALANQLAKRFPEVSFVFRPHPFEDLAAYQGRLEHRTNLHLIRTGAIDGWLLRSIALIHFNCSTALEAAMAGIPVLTPMWVAASTGVTTIEQASMRCASSEELVAALADIIDRRFSVSPQVQQHIDGVLGDWFFPIDGRAHERMAAAIMQLLAARQPLRLSPWKDRHHRKRLRGQSLRSDVSALLRRLLLPQRTGTRNGGPVWTDSQKAFDSPRVSQLVGAFRQAPHAPFDVAAASDRRAYRDPRFRGHSVVIQQRGRDHGISAPHQTG